RKPLEYARSKSGRRRTRSAGASPCPSFTGSALVSHSQAFPSFGAAPLEHDSAVLGGHANAKPMGVLASPDVGLKCSLPLHTSTESYLSKVLRECRRKFQ